MTTSEYRVEHDSMGALDVPATALWGAQTQRAIRNFPAQHVYYEISAISLFLG